MNKRTAFCANCKFFCQDVDPDNRLYFDEKAGECRALPPSDNFVWKKTRLHHWCGHWQPSQEIQVQWAKTEDHNGSSKPVLLYRNQSFCKNSGFIVGYWNEAFNKWHDGGDQLFDRDHATHWMILPKPPQLLK